MIEEASSGFAGATQQWWSLASHLLGWKPNDFWCATPTELIGALSEPKMGDGLSPTTRQTIARMLERESDG